MVCVLKWWMDSVNKNTERIVTIIFNKIRRSVIEFALNDTTKIRTKFVINKLFATFSHSIIVFGHIK